MLKPIPSNPAYLKLSPTTLVIEHDVQAYNVKRIKYIKDNYDPLRSKSKPVSFALQYSGTANTLVNNSGFNPEEAKAIVSNYKDLYKESEEYTTRRIAQAEQQGYLDVAFGLRIRTPVLAKSILGNSKTPYLATAEARTIGNALCQSYGLLTNRALNEFMERVWNSEYAMDIYPVATIHQWWI